MTPDSIMKLNRPKLRQIPFPKMPFSPGLVFTMSIGQWDTLLDAAYHHGSLLIEVNQSEIPVRAYQKLMNQN